MTVVAAPSEKDQRSLSTFLAIDDDTAELPMLALIFNEETSPVIMGSVRDCLMFSG